jgi:DHA2 family multidrug resistance protein
MRGVGQILGMLFLSQACVRSVPRELAGDASGLFNSVRNLGAASRWPGLPSFRTTASGSTRAGWRKRSTPTA